LLAGLASARAEPRAGPRVERLRDTLRPLLLARYPDAAVRLGDLDRLVSAAADAGDLGTFVAELVLDPPASTADLARPPHLDDDYLVLSTVHSAKGLEWEAVHVIQASDGNFPSDMALSSPDGLEEERRLFYVALTRARRALHIYVPGRFYHRPRGRDDAHSYGQTSRFLSPSVQACCELVQATEPTPAIAASGVPARAARIEVSLEELWR